MAAFIAYCTGNPEMQTRIQKQIDDVLGSRSPVLTDRPLLPLVEAAIMETLRLSSMVPTLVPHVTNVDLKFHGYDIPKGTEVKMV